MAEIRFKARKNEIRLAVIVERDGKDETKELVFNCSANDYRYIKNVTKAYADMQSAVSGKVTMEKTNKMLDAERAVFEAAAPGKWDEFLDFIGGDIEYMAKLITLMVTTIQTKGTEAKLAEMAPVMPDVEIV